LYTVSVAVAGEGGLHVVLGAAAESVGLLPTATDESTAAPDEGPSPITPETKELLWGLGAFLVLLVAMRLYLVPKVKRGMAARRGLIHSGHERAGALRAEAQGEVAEYERALAAVKAEGTARIEAASRQLEAERTERLAGVTTTIAERRAAAAADFEAAKAAARPMVADAVVDVASRTVELGIGRRPDGAAVRRVVDEVVGAGVVS
jgi:F-type H+-transporting ATPase subunit b